MSFRIYRKKYDNHYRYYLATSRGELIATCAMSRKYTKAESLFQMANECGRWVMEEPNTRLNDQVAWNAFLDQLD